MPKRKFQIDQLIINSPYEEPSTYWSYDREVRMFERKDGRRPAGYVVATPGSKAFDDPGMFVELPLVNRIRPRVKAWREADYPGVSGITSCGPRMKTKVAAKSSPRRTSRCRGIDCTVTSERGTRTRLRCV